jgi:hypothetical protein
MRGPRREPERSASTGGQAASAIRSGPLGCPDHRRDRKSDARRPRIGRVPTGMPDGASVRGTITEAPAQGDSVGGSLPSGSARAIGVGDHCQARHRAWGRARGAVESAAKNARGYALPLTTELAIIPDWLRRQGNAFIGPRRSVEPPPKNPLHSSRNWCTAVLENPSAG